MTVIVYSRKHHMMASDSLLSDDESDLKITRTRKIFKLKNGAVVGTAGDEDWREVRKLLEYSSPGNMPSGERLAKTKTDFLGIIVYPGGAVFAVEINYDDDKTKEWEGGVIRIREPFFAVGVGASLATGALEAGAKPRQAVRIACKHHTGCGLPVQWRKV